LQFFFRSLAVATLQLLAHSPAAAAGGEEGG
jgi:hypothetical protein